jgi:hypothetical protein
MEERVGSYERKRDPRDGLPRHSDTRRTSVSPVESSYVSTDSHQSKTHLLEFRQRVFGIDYEGRQKPEFKEISEQLHNAAERLSTDLYDEDLHFVFELIQNAEDNAYETRVPELRFVLLEDDPTGTNGAMGCLCVFNNETGFEPNNVESIASIGKSTKTKASGYIGEKGIGFKSVFVVTASPHIFSGGYQFRFLESDPRLGLGYVVPYWVDDVPEIVASTAVATSAARDGFSLNCAVACEVNERAKLERLCRYMARGPIAQERLSVDGDGLVVLELKRAFSDGTTHVL